MTLMRIPNQPEVILLSQVVTALRELGIIAGDIGLDRLQSVVLGPTDVTVTYVNADDPFITATRTIRTRDDL